MYADVHTATRPTKNECKKAKKFEFLEIPVLSSVRLRVTKNTQLKPVFYSHKYNKRSLKRVLKIKLNA